MSNNYNNIPEELKRLNQWCCWRYEDVEGKKPTKVPYGPNGNPASVNSPKTWMDFDSAVRMSTNGYSGIGFVFSDQNNYTFIDLDDCKTLPNGSPNPNYETDLARQIKVYQEFDSYSEVSPSGSGLHIIIRGNVPNGRKRNFIEIYSSQRYATFTGNVYNNKPIVDQQEKLTQLWEQMGSVKAGTVIFQGDANEKYSDEEIIEQAKAATNGDKFQQLYSGDWQNSYQSQSEADFALIDIVAFYTQNKNQITRIFSSSQLGRRDKAKRQDYLGWMINKSFDRMLPQLDFDGFKNALEDKIAQPKKQLELEIKAPEVKTSITIPPGLLGEIAQFIYQAAPRPVPEIALAGAIGLMAGICGRAYNISNTGLNQYILCLAKTGMGKEGIASGIDKLMNAIQMQVPTANDFIGPSHIASGQALVKYIHKKSQCFVSILGEFGITIQNISNSRANPHETKLKQELLAIYQKSGFTDIYRASIQADLEKNTEVTHSPSFTILGESTPHSFYQYLSEEMIVEGLLPRFLLIEYDGIRVDENPHHATAKPSFQLTDKFSSLIANCQMIMHAKPRRVINIKFDEAAAKMATDFDHYATNKINATTDEVTLNLWNRAHLKSIKLAGLIAVGVNMSDPIITSEYLSWSINMIQSDIKALSAKFEAGEVGLSVSETKQKSEVERMIKWFVVTDWDKVISYSQGKSDKAMHKDKVIPYAILSKRLVATSSFRNDRGGATFALKRVLQLLIDTDRIREINKLELANKYNTTQRAFIVTDTSILD